MPENVDLEPERLSTSSVVEKLNPYEIVDADGATRQVFTFRTKQYQIPVVFFSREDLPFNRDILIDKQGYILAEPCKFRPVKEWKEFIEDVQEASIGKKIVDPTELGYRFNGYQNVNKTVFFVENTPVHLLDFAFCLGFEDRAYRVARQKATEGIFTLEAKDLVESLISATIIGDNGEKKRRTGQEGEALVILALLGNSDAQKIVDYKKVKLNEIDRADQEVKENSFKNEYQGAIARGERLTIRGKTAYHTTNFCPQITPDGAEIGSTFDETRGQALINTVHFSLVGPVNKALGGGEWENMDYVIIGDLLKIKDANGNPRKMGEIDTYWTVAPGDKLLVPGAHIIMPGKLPSGEIRVTEENVTKYKKGPLSPADIDRLFKDYHHSSYDNEKIEENIKSAFHRKIWIENIRFDVLINNLRTQGIRSTVESVLTDYYPNYTTNDIRAIIRSIEAYLVTCIRNGGFSTYLGSGENSTNSSQINLLAWSWGADGTTARMVHFFDSETWGDRANSIFYFFKKVSEVQQEIEDAKKTGSMILNCELGPGCYGLRYNDVYDRIKVMTAINTAKKERKISQDPKIRAMHYLAGLI